jgi:hypothetical protein
MTWPTQPLTVHDGSTETGTGSGAYGGDGLHHLSLQVSGIVAGDIIQVEASNDGENWAQVGSDIDADGVYAVELGAFYYRANYSDNSGGGPVTAIFNGG